jgi:hypothetical protein
VVRDDNRDDLICSQGIRESAQGRGHGGATFKASERPVDGTGGPDVWGPQLASRLSQSSTAGETCPATTRAGPHVDAAVCVRCMGQAEFIRGPVEAESAHEVVFLLFAFSFTIFYLNFFTTSKV